VYPIRIPLAAAVRRVTCTSAGFTLVETTVAMGIMGVLAAVSAIVLVGMVRDSRADSALLAAANTLRSARDRAIGERRNVEVRFIAPNRIQLARVEVPGPATTVIADVYLEGQLEFRTLPGVPDTPDRFGAADAVAFGASPTRMFTSDGSFVDTTGDPLNGTIFMGIAGLPTSARAVTVFGATGLTRGWRWNGGNWIQ
jgi:type II secretory pathway pseudopilin PulG